MCCFDNKVTDNCIHRRFARTMAAAPAALAMNTVISHWGARTSLLQLVSRAIRICVRTLGARARNGTAQGKGEW